MERLWNPPAGKRNLRKPTDQSNSTKVVGGSKLNAISRLAGTAKSIHAKYLSYRVLIFAKSFAHPAAENWVFPDS